MIRPALAILVLFLTLAIARPSAAAWPNNPLTNLPVCTAANNQNGTVLVSDGAGGAIIAWADFRGGATSDIYAQHVLASGAVDPAWPANGRALCTASGEQSEVAIVPDGAGGAVVAWTDHRAGTTSDVYAQHVLASGTVDPAWPLDGRAVCAAIEYQAQPRLVPDGAGGAIVAWMDGRAGNYDYDVYAQHLLVSGALDAAWPSDGRALCVEPNYQGMLQAAPDGAGGAIVAWEDARAGAMRDIYAQRVLASGVVPPGWPVNGLAVCTAANYQFWLQLVSDGASGAIVTWLDARTGGDVYAQHVMAAGTVDPGWPADGRSLSPAVSSEGIPALMADGSGGAIVAWEDWRSAANGIYVQHVLASGATDPAWPVNGRKLCASSISQTYPEVVPDAGSAGGGGTGAIIAWTDERGGAGDLYVQRVLGSGAVDPTWPADGRALSTAPGSQQLPKAIPDGLGGAIVTWVAADVYAQRVAPFGYLGSPEPELVSVADLPADQGGQVRIKWLASQLDSWPTYDIGWYGIWRQVSQADVLAGLSAGSKRVSEDGPNDVAPGTYRALEGATHTTWWEGVGMVSARGEAWYTFVAGTFQDSSAGGNPLTTFMVDSHMARAVGFWSSLPASGYSVDDLAPATPAPFAGRYMDGAAQLHWSPNAEGDLAGYRLYRGADPAFMPGPANFVVALTDTEHVDFAGAPHFYKLTAVDVHGNESIAATLLPLGTLDADAGAILHEMALGSPRPNPASSRTTFRYALPRAGMARLAIFDVAGREVRVLSSGPQSAGEHHADWDLRDGAGRAVSAGLYFAKLEANGRTRSRRVVVAR